MGLWIGNIVFDTPWGGDLAAHATARLTSAYGIECSGAVATPVPGLAAWTIMPLPMYMPTWLIGL